MKKNIFPGEGLSEDSPSNSMPAPQRILLAEDDANIREIGAAVLAQAGYAVDAVGDGAAAWAKLQANHFDLLVTDNSMPKLSGVDLLKRLRGAKMTVPVIMATGTLPRNEFLRTPELAPAMMLTKPYTAQELLGAVQMLLSGAGAAAGRLPGMSPANGQRPPEMESWQLGEV